ncbi:MAG: dTDP-glucose 4,6-dehydratase [Micrococcales bacterium]|nr:dTDP-glucose 4,6-dehydratase [Micrococcales bacterium]
MRVLITGAAGFIGSNFVRMIAKGDLLGVSSVKVLDKLTYAGVKSNLDSVADLSWYEFKVGDICDREVVSELLREVDAVVNFAAESHVDRSILGAANFVQTNIVGVQVLLDAIKESGRRIRFLQVSTDEVYGSIESGSWTEEWPLQPNSPYSASKASGELLARSYNRTHGMDVVITRCSNNYGTHHFPEKLIPLFITNLMEGKKVPVYGTGENVRDWLHVNDHCRGIHSVLMNGRSGEVYNIGGGRELTNNEITSLILEAMGADESSIEYVEDRKGHDLRYSVDWTKINRELGYEPKVKFEDGLRETIQWYRDNESWWKPLKNR